MDDFCIFDRVLCKKTDSGATLSVLSFCFYISNSGYMYGALAHISLNNAMPMMCKHITLVNMSAPSAIPINILTLYMSMTIIPDIRRILTILFSLLHVAFFAECITTSVLLMFYCYSTYVDIMQVLLDGKKGLNNESCGALDSLRK